MGEADALEVLSRENKAVFKRSELLERLSRRTFDRAVEDGRLTVMHDGVIAVSPSPVDLVTTARAALAWAGRELIASHKFAAWLHRFDCSVPAIEFSEHHKNRYLAAPGVRIHRVRDLSTNDTYFRRGFHTTKISRTVLDLADSDAPRRMIVGAFEDARRRGSLYRDEIVQHIQSAKKHRPGWDLLLDLANRRGRYPVATESAAESICCDVMWQWHFRPQRQLELFTASRHFVARLDFAFPEIKLGVEVDGYATHGSRHAFYRDKRRIQEIQRLGWEVFPVVWADLDDELRFISALSDVIQHRKHLFRIAVASGLPLREQMPLPL